MSTSKNQITHTTDQKKFLKTRGLNLSAAFAIAIEGYYLVSSLTDLRLAYNIGLALIVGVIFYILLTRLKLRTLAASLGMLFVIFAIAVEILKEWFGSHLEPGMIVLLIWAFIFNLNVLLKQLPVGGTENKKFRWPFVPYKTKGSAGVAEYQYYADKAGINTGYSHKRDDVK